MPVVSKDDRVLFFARELPNVGWTIFSSRRASPDTEFGPPSRVTELDTSYTQFPSWISDDQCRFYIISTAPVLGGPPGSGPARLRVASRSH